MKGTIICLSLLLAAFALSAQPPAAGMVHFESTGLATMNLAGRTASQKMSMQLRLTFSGVHYKVEAALGQESGFGFIGSMVKFYDPAEKALYQIVETNGERIAMLSHIPRISSFKLTGRTDTLLGYTCKEFTCLYQGDTARGWFTDALPDIISPIGPQPVPGALLKLISEKAEFTARSISIGDHIEITDLQMPKNIRRKN